MTHRSTFLAIALLAAAASVSIPRTALAQSYETKEYVDKADKPHFPDLDTVTTKSSARELGGMDGKLAGTRISPVAMAVPAVLLGAVATAIPAISAVGLVVSGFMMIKPNFGDKYIADNRPERENEYWRQYYKSRAKSRGIRTLGAAAVGTAVGTGIYLARH